MSGQPLQLPKSRRKRALVTIVPLSFSPQPSTAPFVSARYCPRPFGAFLTSVLASESPTIATWRERHGRRSRQGGGRRVAVRGEAARRRGRCRGCRVARRRGRGGGRRPGGGRCRQRQLLLRPALGHIDLLGAGEPHRQPADEEDGGHGGDLGPAPQHRAVGAAPSGCGRAGGRGAAPDGRLDEAEAGLGEGDVSTVHRAMTAGRGHPSRAGGTPPSPASARGSARRSARRSTRAAASTAPRGPRAGCTAAAIR